LPGQPAPGRGQTHHSATPAAAISGWKVGALTIALVSLVLAAAGLFVLTLSILILIFAGLVFGVFLGAIAGWIANRSPAPYRLAYALVVGAFLAAIAGGGYYLGSQATQRADQFVQRLQTSVETASERYETPQWVEQFLPEGESLQSVLLPNRGSVIPEMLSGFQRLGWGLTGTLVILFVGLYAAYEPQLYRTGLIKLVSPDRRDRAEEVLAQVQRALGRWIVGRIVSMGIIGILTAVGLWWLGVPLPMTLGVVAALLTFIPNIGPLLAAIPQLLLALNINTTTALYVLVLNIVLQTIESYLITPMIQRREVSLPPILTISAQLLMGALVGIIGVMMAAPLVVVAMVLVQMLYIHDRLGDPHPGELTECG